MGPRESTLITHTKDLVQSYQEIHPALEALIFGALQLQNLFKNMFFSPNFLRLCQFTCMIDLGSHAKNIQ